MRLRVRVMGEKESENEVVGESESGCERLSEGKGESEGKNEVRVWVRMR